MIKLKQIVTTHGEAVLVFDVSFPDETVQEVEITLGEIKGKLKILKSVVGRQLTLKDVKDVIVNIVNLLRQDKQALEERFDFSQWIGVDLEG